MITLGSLDDRPRNVSIAVAGKLLRWTVDTPAFIALLVLVGIAAFAQPRALTLPFLMIVVRQATPLALLAMGQSLPVIGRSIDLSVGGVIAVTNVLLANSTVASGPWWFSIGMPIVLGIGVGLCNSLLIVKLKASAVVVTLGMSVVLVGLSYVASGGAPGGDVHGLVRAVAITRIGPVPIVAMLLIAVAISLALILRCTVFGATLKAVGSSYVAAWLGGLPVARCLILTHVISGAMAGLASIVLTGYIGTGSLNLGGDLVLASVAAVVLGGVNFGSARGGVTGTVAGAVVITYLGTLLNGIGVPQPFQLVFQGVVIALASGFAQRKS